MNPTSLLLPAAVAAIVLLASARRNEAADAPKPIEVKVVHPTRGEIIRYVKLPGTIRANQQATIYAKVAGYLKTISVDKGDRVQAGQSLGEIEVPELQADLAKYKAEVKGAWTAAMVTVADLKVVRAQVPLREVEASLAKVGQRVRFTVEGLAGKTFDAQISRFTYALDDATKTMLVEADLPNPELLLRPS